MVLVPELAVMELYGAEVVGAAPGRLEMLQLVEVVGVDQLQLLLHLEQMKVI